MSNFIAVIDEYDNAITVIGAGADEKAKEKTRGGCGVATYPPTKYKKGVKI